MTTLIEKRDALREQLLLLDDDIRDFAESHVHEDGDDVSSAFAYTQPEVAPLALPSTEALDGLWSEAQMRARKRTWTWAVEHGDLGADQRRYMSQWLSQARRGSRYCEYRTPSGRTRREWWTPEQIQLGVERDERHRGDIIDWLQAQPQPSRLEREAFDGEPAMIVYDAEFDSAADDARGALLAAIHAVEDQLLEHEAESFGFSSADEYVGSLKAEPTVPRAHLREWYSRRTQPTHHEYRGHSAELRWAHWDDVDHDAGQKPPTMRFYFREAGPAPQRPAPREYPELQPERLRRWHRAVMYGPLS